MPSLRSPRLEPPPSLCDVVSRHVIRVIRYAFSITGGLRVGVTGRSRLTPSPEMAL